MLLASLPLLYKAPTLAPTCYTRAGTGYGSARAHRHHHTNTAQFSTASQRGEVGSASSKAAGDSPAQVGEGGECLIIWSFGLHDKPSPQRAFDHTFGWTDKKQQNSSTPPPSSSGCCCLKQVPVRMCAAQVRIEQKRQARLTNAYGAAAMPRDYFSMQAIKPVMFEGPFSEPLDAKGVEAMRMWQMYCAQVCDCVFASILISHLHHPWLS